MNMRLIVSKQLADEVHIFYTWLDPNYTPPEVVFKGTLKGMLLMLPGYYSTPHDATRSVEESSKRYIIHSASMST